MVTVDISVQTNKIDLLVTTDELNVDLQLNTQSPSVDLSVNSAIYTIEDPNILRRISDLEEETDGKVNGVDISLYYILERDN